MTIRYDAEVDAAYISIGRLPLPGEATDQVPDIHGPRREGEIVLDFDSEGHLIGIEILQASRLLRPEDIRRAEDASSSGV